jgi:hypothetical protein
MLLLILGDVVSQIGDQLLVTKARDGSNGEFYLPDGVMRVVRRRLHVTYHLMGQ